MRKISSKEIARFNDVPRRGRRKSPLIEEASKLEIGEMLFIPSKEWKGFNYAKTTTPSILLVSAVSQKRKGHISKAMGKKFKVRRYQEGWVIKRIK